MADSPQKDALIQFDMPVLDDPDKLLVTTVRPNAADEGLWG